MYVFVKIAGLELRIESKGLPEEGNKLWEGERSVADIQLSDAYIENNEDARCV